jgi:hypothetical protein
MEMFSKEFGTMGFRTERVNSFTMMALNKRENGKMDNLSTDLFISITLLFYFIINGPSSSLKSMFLLFFNKKYNPLISKSLNPNSLLIYLYHHSL